MGLRNEIRIDLEREESERKFFYNKVRLFYNRVLSLL